MKEKIISVSIQPTPKIIIRVIDEQNDDTLQMMSKKKYPFQLINKVNVLVITTKRKFTFQVHKGYIYNGADIPKPLWWLGSSKDNDYLVASMCHDYLLEFKEKIYNSIENITPKEYRRLTSLIFREILKNEDTGTIKANIMSWAVDVFQATINKGQWKCLK